MSSGLELRVGNKYRLGRKIGSGSFGDIYLGASPARPTRSHRAPFRAIGTHIQTGEEVGIKLVRFRAFPRALVARSREETLGAHLRPLPRVTHSFPPTGPRRLSRGDFFRARADVAPPRALPPLRNPSRRSTRSCCTSPSCTRSSRAEVRPRRVSPSLEKKKKPPSRRASVRSRFPVLVLALVVPPAYETSATHLHPPHSNCVHRSRHPERAMVRRRGRLQHHGARSLGPEPRGSVQLLQPQAVAEDGADARGPARVEDRVRAQQELHSPRYQAG
eukprot:29101-Pelagococcus_subviridis.AAC.2